MPNEISKRDSFSFATKAHVDAGRRMWNHTGKQGRLANSSMDAEKTLPPTARDTLTVSEPTAMATSDAVSPSGAAISVPVAGVVSLHDGVASGPSVVSIGLPSWSRKTSENETVWPTVTVTLLK